MKLHDINRVPLAIACSGGGDSMALVLLAQNWAKTNGCRIIALTVDHGLRKESAAEAKQVGLWLKKHGIAHAILKWVGAKPTSNIQEEARKARYRLMADYCQTHKILHLLVAHHKEDQAETFLLRLARGSGVDGLAAMAATTQIHGVTLLRPLLDASKAELLQYLKTRKQPYVNDPSNENLLYDRIKIRALLPELAKVGLTAERLVRTASNMARARAHLEEETGRFLGTACKIFPEGYALLRHIKTSDEIALRALATLIMCIGGQETKTRLNDLERLHQALKKLGFKGATLGGCIFIRHKKEFLICREPRAVAAPLPIKSGETLIWDNRFEFSLTVTPHSLRGPVKKKGWMPQLMRHDNFTIGALNQEGWLFCARNHKLENPAPDKRILYSLPALRDKDGWLLAVPNLGLSAEGFQCNTVFNTPV